VNDYDAFTYEVEQGAALVTIDKPESLNSLTRGEVGELIDALHAAEADDDLRAVVLTGAGSAFSAGFDMDELESFEDPESVEEWLDWLEAISEAVFAVYELDLPVVAAVNGHALAEGNDLAVIADITIASDRATFGYPGVRMGGFPPTLVYPFVTGSMKYVRELLYTGKVIDADRAAEMGMVNRVVDHDDLLDEAFEEVAAIRRVPSQGVRLAKHALNDVTEMQGFRPTVRQSQYVDALGHLTAAGQHFFELWEEEGTSAAIEWMNEAEKD